MEGGGLRFSRKTLLLLVGLQKVISPVPLFTPKGGGTFSKKEGIPKGDDLKCMCVCVK